MESRTCTIELVGIRTVGRKWINYEIAKSWEKGMGVLGTQIHNLLDRHGEVSFAGGHLNTPHAQLRMQ